MQNTSEAGAPPARTMPYAWYVAGLLSLGYLVSIMDRYIVSVVQEEIKADLLLSDSQIGFLQGPAFVFLFALSSLPLGRLADTVNRVRLVFAGIMVWSVATMACAFATNFNELFYARLGVGLGEAALLPCAMSLISAYFSRDKLSRGVSIYTMGGSFGRVVGFAGGGALLTFFAAREGLEVLGLGLFKPWHSVFIIAGLVGIAVGILFVLTVREPKRAPVASGAKADVKSGLSYAWHHRLAYASIFIPFSAIAAIAAVLSSWSVSLYVREFGLTAAQASYIIGLGGLIVAPIGHLFGGWLSDKLRARGRKDAQPMILVVMMTLSTMFSCAFVMAPSVTLAAIFYVLAYLCSIGCSPTGFSGIQFITPERYRGLISSLFMLTFMLLGSGSGPYLAGLVNDHLFGTGADGRLSYAMMITAVFLLVIAVPFAFWGRKAFERAAIENDQASGHS